MVKKTITPEDVKKIATLSKLDIAPNETERFAELLSEALDSLDVLNELDTSKVSETFQVTGTHNVFQDGSSKTLVLDDVFKNAKNTSEKTREKRGMFVTSAVFDRGAK